MKIDLETVQEKIEELRSEFRKQPIDPSAGNSFEAGRVCGAISALMDLKIELLQWELQERTKGKQ